MKNRASCILIGGIAAALWLPSFGVSANAPSRSALQEGSRTDASMLIQLGGDARHDLARLLKPLVYTLPGSPAVVLEMTDAIYNGVAAADARLLSLWTVSGQDPNVPRLGGSDGNAALPAIRDRLLAGRSPAPTFALCTLNVHWAAWTVTVTTVPPCLVAGTGPLRTTLEQGLAQPAPVTSFDTSNVVTPIGSSKSTGMSWQPWFRSDRVVFQLKPRRAASALPAVALPAVSFEAESGLQLDEGFIGHVLDTSYGDDLFTLGGRYHLSRIAVSVQSDVVAVSGQLQEVPADRDNRVEAKWTGHPLKLDDIRADPSCRPSVPALACSTFRFGENAKVAILRQALRGFPLQPSGEDRDLGVFTVGRRQLTGQASVRDLRGVQNALRIALRVRLAPAVP